jgi:hypothetical protein
MCLRSAEFGPSQSGLEEEREGQARGGGFPVSMVSIIVSHDCVELTRGGEPGGDPCRAWSIKGQTKARRADPTNAGTIPPSATSMLAIPLSMASIR